MSQTKRTSSVPSTHKDLIFDLCTSILPFDLPLAHKAFDTIYQELEKTKLTDRFVKNERAWVFHIARNHLLKVQTALDALSISDQIELDALAAPANRLKQFSSFFLRLPVDDRILILLRDKFGLPYPEIASCYRLSEETLKLRRGRILRTLEEWIWSVQ